MTDYNVLILSAGRRVELVQAFQKAKKNLNLNGRIIAGDCSDLAPALFFADSSVKLPRISDKSYISTIIDICQVEKISVIIPTIDTDLLLLSENKMFIENQTNAKVLISDLDVVKVCRNKIKTQEFLMENGFCVPKMYNIEELGEHTEFPLFIKPISGSSSINTYKVHNTKELYTYLDLIEYPIIQEFIEGEEYTVDVFLDFEGNLITVVPRLRIAVRSGEISKGRIIKDTSIIKDVTRLMEVLKPVGHITVQLMKTKEGIKYIEINPRFGGGAPMSIHSGANSCENIFKLLKGEKLEYNEKYKDNITFLRFDNSICIDDNYEILRI